MSIDALFPSMETPTSDGDLARLLYPSMAPAQPLKGADPQDGHSDLASALYPSMNPPPQHDAPRDSFYPSMAADAAEPAESETRTPRTEAEQAAALFGKPEAPAPLAEVPPEVQELRNLAERRMFDAQGMLRDAVPELTDEQCEAEGIDPAVARQATAEVREVAADLDLGALDVRTLRTRVETLRSTPVETITQRESAVEALNREFGNGAYQAWLDARALVARDPRVGKMIETMGLGDDAETIVMLAKKARSQRAAGKLKQPTKRI